MLRRKMARDGLQIKRATSSSLTLLSFLFSHGKCFPFLRWEKVVGNSESGWSAEGWSGLLMPSNELRVGSAGLPFE